jgi:uncharacterized protein YdhG (YjbR/CyaY superfamily)
MSVIDDYLASLSGPEKALIAHMYEIVRREVPEATEGISYGMPAFKYEGKGLVAIMANKYFLSLYPFCAVEKLGLDVSNFECTSGSIHFNTDKPITDDLLRQILIARMRLFAVKEK